MTGSATIVGPGRCRFRHDPVHLLRAGQVVAERDAGDRAGGTYPGLGVHLPGVPQGKDQAVVDLDEHHITGNFPVDRPAEAFRIEPAGGVNTANA